VSHHFEVQSGRTHLIGLEKNVERFDQLAHLLDALPTALEQCLMGNEERGVVVSRFWESWRLDRGDKASEMLRVGLAQGLCRLAINCHCVPTLDLSNCAILGQEPLLSFQGIPDEFRNELIEKQVEVLHGLLRVKLSLTNVVPERWVRLFAQVKRVAG